MGADPRPKGKDSVRNRYKARNVQEETLLVRVGTHQKGASDKDQDRKQY